jgi:hypothetical protein
MIVKHGNNRKKYVKFVSYGEYWTHYSNQFHFKISDYPQTIDNKLVITSVGLLHEKKYYRGSTEPNYSNKATVPEFLKWLDGLRDKGKCNVSLLYESEEEMNEILKALRLYKEGICKDIDMIINPDIMTNETKMIEMKGEIAL